MEKWIGFATQHGLAVVGALLLAIAAVAWVEPTTSGGVAFLLFLVFVVSLAVFEVIGKVWIALRRRRTSTTTDQRVEAPEAVQRGEESDTATPTDATTSASAKHGDGPAAERHI